MMVEGKERFLSEMKQWNLIKSNKDLKLYREVYKDANFYLYDSLLVEFKNLIDTLESENDFRRYVKRRQGKKNKFALAFTYFYVRANFQRKILDCPFKAGPNCVLENKQSCTILNCLFKKSLLEKRPDFIYDTENGIVINAKDYLSDEEIEEKLKFTDALSNEFVDSWRSA